MKMKITESGIGRAVKKKMRDTKALPGALAGYVKDKYEQVKADRSLENTRQKATDMVMNYYPTMGPQKTKARRKEFYGMVKDGDVVGAVNKAKKLTEEAKKLNPDVPVTTKVERDAEDAARKAKQERIKKNTQ